MKNFLTFLIFVGVLSLGIWVDSLLVNLISVKFQAWFSMGINAVIWLKIALWTIFSLLTGSFIFMGAFVTSGMIRTTLK